MMSVDKLALYDNVLGVFADLDDGGLTEDEALAKIREIAGANRDATWVVTCDVRFTATVVVGYDNENEAEDLGREAIGEAIEKIKSQFEDDTNIDINGLSDQTVRVARSEDQ